MTGKKAALMVTGIITGIIAICFLLAIFVGVPVLKNMKYNNAQKNAEAGQYIVALSELNGRNMDEYKDVKLKKQEYSIAAAKQYIDQKDYRSANVFLNLAIEINADEALTKEAKKLYEEVKKK